MSTMNNGTSWNDAVTINKQSGTKITLDTDSKFVAKDIELTINVQAGSAKTPNTAITANPTLSINSSTGVVTGTVSTTKSVTPTISAGYVSTGSAGTMTVSGSNTLSLSTQAAQTITPGTTNKTIAAGKYLTGTQTIAGDSNLVAANIAEGVSIFGVAGTHSSGVDTSDATATANDILSNKTAYVNGSKITGNIPSKSSSNLTASGATVTAPAGYYSTAATKTIDSGSTTQNAPTINSSTGLVTATATVTAGYQGASTKSNTLQLTAQAAQTITPGTTNQTISSGRYLTGTQTIKGDANLVASNIAQGVSIFGVTGTHSGGGGTDPTDFIENHDTWTSYENLSASEIGRGTFAFCSRLTTVNFPSCTIIDKYAFHYCYTLSNVSFPKCTYICSYAFHQCYSLSTASFPVCTNIDEYAFNHCSKLSTASFPVCTYIGGYAFNQCYLLSNVSFPKCTYIGGYAFYQCSSLTTVSFPSCTSIAGHAFNQCSKLSNVSFPKCTYIGGSAFNFCTKLPNASFPLCTNINNYAFQQCYSLSTVSFPVCTNIGSYAFQQCFSLTTVSFPACTHISASAFRSCRILVSLYLTGSSYVSLVHSNAFSYTPIGGYSASAGQYGSIYVPASMLASYKTMTNWTYFSSRFVGV